MNNFDFQIYNSAFNLPQRWDEIAKDNYAFKREFLQFLEKVNPCKQKYHISNTKNIILISYNLDLNIFTYTKKLKLNLPINIVGIPISIAEKGYICDDEEIYYLSGYLNSFSLVLVLNTLNELYLPSGNTLPAYSLNLEDSFEIYLSKMRSHYRYRVNKALKKGKNLIYEQINPYDFSEKMYSLYEEVYERSDGKLEKLGIDYFKNSNAEIFTVKENTNDIIGFFQIFEYKNELIFLFCGIDKEKNKNYDLYMNILIKIIKIGIDRNLKKIHFGQTTQHTKTHLGARQQKRYLNIASRFIPNFILEKMAKSLGKNENISKQKVFKE